MKEVRCRPAENSTAQPLGRFRRGVIAAGLLLGLVMLSGCLLAVPFIDAFKESGVTPSDRRRLLPKKMKDFHEALIWRDVNMAMTMVAAGSQEAVRPTFNNLRKQKIVDASVENVDFNDDATTATVSVVLRFYEEPFYVVRNREERQEWEFRTGIGWELTARELLAITDG